MIGTKIDGYEIKEKIGNGAVGTVYRAERISDIYNVRAIKLISACNIRPDWAHEIIKVNKLERVPGIVMYHAHGNQTINNEEFLWIMWQFIPGESLKSYIKKKMITIPIVKGLLNQILEVFHACQKVGVNHGDLHTGNVLIGKPDDRLISSAHPVWITDFGYKASLGSGTLNDYEGLNRIIQDCLEAMDFHALEGQDKQAYTVLKNEFPKFLLETDYTQGNYVKNPFKLLQLFNERCHAKASSINIKSKNIQDYLAAEIIGEQFDEWGKLFVPKFLGMEQLLGKNVCILTGLRGCGKTMIFRRLTAFFDIHLGRPTGIDNSDSFLGFYLNARNIAEAFPWLPRNKKDNARAQVIHYFHVSWTIEVIKWLKELSKEKKQTAMNYSWLIDFINKYFPSSLVTVSEEKLILSNLLSFLSSELEGSRLQSSYKAISWPLSDYTYLEKLFELVKNNMKNESREIFYLFLDDYSTPLVKDVIQEILNPIVFRRSSTVIFKVSTESIESFVPIGLNNKSLEEGDDYILIDSGSESIHKDKEVKKGILSSILKPRIDRHTILSQCNLELSNILGASNYDNNAMALLIRSKGNDTKGKESKDKLKYYGYDIFCSVWSSNVREMINIFANMVASSSIKNIDSVKKSLSSNKRVIEEKIQDTVLRTAGGNYLQLLSSAMPDTSNSITLPNHEPFGDHLVKIAQSFKEIALHELRNKNSKNLRTNPPKQARRIEIKEVKEFNSDLAREYYKGIIRYGLFIRDNRGKSVRGKAVPRLVLRGLVIPYFTMTFSTRDNIMLKWEQFCELLEFPEKFSIEYIKKQEKKQEKQHPMRY